MPSEPQGRHLRWFALSTVPFSTSYALLPLYSSNQNHHFLIGLARAGQGWLKDDWLAQTVDPFPLFTALLVAVHRFADDAVHYVLYCLLLGAYAYGLMRLVEHVRPTSEETRTVERLLFLAAVCLLHSEALAYLAGVDLAHLPWWQITHWGVAEQEIFGHGMFQPSAVGMLLPLAMVWAIEGHLIRSTALAGVVLAVHFSYALTAGALSVAFAITAARQTRRIGYPLAVAGTFLAFAVPTLAYVLLQLGPTSPEVSFRAASILARHIPQEADPAVWLGAKAWLQLGLVIAGVSMATGTALFLPLLVPTLAGVALTSAQIASGSPQLALLFPWRVSVLLVPTAAALLVRLLIARGAETASWRSARVQRRLSAAALAVLALTVLAGAVRMTLHFAYFYDYRPLTERMDAALPDRWRDDFARALAPDTLPMMDFVRQSSARGDLYLVPPELERFRLRTGTPIVADLKSHPYKDAEVLEWFDRLQLVEAFYRSGDCRILSMIEARFSVTHVVLDDRVRPNRCTGLALTYSDRRFDIYKVGVSANVRLKATECCGMSAGIDLHTSESSPLSSFCSPCR